ncbi:dicarboxylate carrier UCP2 [Neodiprion pinetum]|uniref:Mitochondrial uncoupling protein 2 n=1 Tax=Neodiprion lecontei TaxID=441921 RepID=A0A6J0C4A4_NEOLC|nr:mitochondrial uncoupling protein 2 [Neodiprion lecontei]XP_015521379.1 mitochondrial uncoupling protein 2 [Neodiprion lecontei]XP_046434953.1 mitochondrial uncoupling protein 2-like [Neodiprion fabricii]XP_046434954.1 mitochondrial uncoupling protein 2-like [Neodiprion fabricii]XP_046434955.1 mitochondrial uncoupling protein 2-like [Neodiprion fabricii]XP_046491567.1 mitochondrial uncoupling protein 2-like [Neodiprion pinetum]XP_046491568.1 mitochondrial uncoupling protein 2-like [Neodipri
MKPDAQNDMSLGMKLLTAGTAACVADLATFPLDTTKVRMQIAGEGRALLLASTEGSVLAVRAAQPGLLQTMGNIVRTEGARSLYGGLSAGLQRQMCFASVRLGLYDTVKSFYAGIIDGKKAGRSDSLNIGTRVAAGITTGALAVLFAQPTDVVKVRLQAGNLGSNTGQVRYTSTLQAYRSIALKEGTRGLWKGTLPNMSRNAIVNVAEIVCYDVIKDVIIHSGILRDGIPCHLTAAMAAGLCTTLAASPVDVVKTRYMNSAPGEYKGALDAAVRMFTQEGPMAFYKGFVPSFARLVSWNIVLWVTYEQIKIKVNNIRDSV